MNKTNMFFFITEALCFILIGIILGHLYINSNLNNSMSSYFNYASIPLSEQNIIKVCSDTSLPTTIYCFKNQIATFYKYKITDDNLHLTLDELKKNGGDCLNWARLYTKLATEKGYHSKIVTIDINNLGNHAVAIISNNQSYCLADELNIRCFEVKV